MSEDENKIFKTEPAFRQKMEDALLDVLNATDLEQAKDAARLALRLAHRLYYNDVLISRELALNIQERFEKNIDVDSRVSAVETQLAKARRRTKADLRAEVLNRDGYRCRYCAVEVTNQNAQIDHWEPDGATEITNLVTACRACNIRKSNIPPRQLAKRTGMSLLGRKPWMLPSDKEVLDCLNRNERARQERMRVQADEQALTEALLAATYQPSATALAEVEALVAAGRVMFSPVEIANWFGVSELKVLNDIKTEQLKALSIGRKVYRISFKELHRLASG